jgi:hypothetical protein
MLKLSARALRVTAVTAAAAFALLPMATASAATVNSSAFGVKATLLTGSLLPAQPVSTCPPGGDVSGVGVNLGAALGRVGVLNAKSDCDATSATSSAQGGAANVRLLGTPLTRLITADAIEANCSATGDAPPTGGTTVANLRVLGIAVNVPVNGSPIDVSIPGVASVIVNEKVTNPDGSLTVNALHVSLLGGKVADVIVGSATCGPNVPVADVSAFSFQDLPVVLGGIALILVIGFGIRTGVRRLRSAA